MRIYLYLFFFIVFCGITSAQSPSQMFWALNQNASFFLDQVPSATASVAYSVRKLKKNYTGFAMKVRLDRPGTDPEANVAFDNNNVVSANSIVTITVAGGSYSIGDKVTFSSFYASRSVYVVTWYDQSGNARHVTQSTTSQQPRIVNTGTLEVSGTRSSIRFLSANSTVLQATIAASVMFTSGYIGTMSSVMEASSGNTSAFGYGNGSDRWQAHMNEGGNIKFDVGNSYARLSSPSNTANVGLLRNYLLIAGGSPSMQIYISGSSFSTSSATLSACGRSDFNIGGIPSFSTYYHNDNISEVVIFNKTLSASEIAIVQKNQKTFFGTP